MDCGTQDGTFCDIYADPDDCLTYRRKMIAEGEESVEGWEFNRFESSGFASFWLLVEQEWAENEKKQLYYPDQACPYCGEPGCSGDCVASAMEEGDGDENW